MSNAVPETLEEPAAGTFDPMQTLLRHKLLILFCGLIGSGIGYLHYVRQPRVYQSSATVLVIPEKTTDLPLKNLEAVRAPEDGLSTQMLLIRSRLVTELAVNPPPVRELPSPTEVGVAPDLDSAAPDVAAPVSAVTDLAAPENAVTANAAPAVTGPAVAEKPVKESTFGERQREKARKSDPLVELPPMIVGSSDPAGALLAGLSVTQARGENGSLAKDVLALSFRGSDPEQCAAALACVIQGYQAYLGATRYSISEETGGLIEDAQKTLALALKDKERKFSDFRQASQLIWDGEQGRNVHQERLAQIETALSELLIQQTQLNAQIYALEEAMKRGDNREALELLASQLAAQQQREPLLQTSGRSVVEQLIELEIEEQLLLERVGPLHRKVQDVRKRMELLKSLSAERSPKKLDSDAPAKAPDRVAVYLDSLHQELAVLTSQIEKMNSLFTAEQVEAKKVSNEVIKNATLLADIARTQQLYDGVVKRLDEINLIRDVKGTYTQVIAKPTRGIQVLPRLTTTIASAALIGLAIGFVLAAGLEMSNREFRGFDEVTRSLNVGLIGHFEQFAALKATAPDSLVAPTLFAYHQPRSPLSEAYRGIRTSIYFSTREQESAYKVIQVTSPMPGDGKTTLTANLAVTIAQSGKRVLLVEADLRRPGAAKLFGLTTDAGLVGAINGDMELDDCLHATEINNLWVLPVGTRPFNPSELLSSQRFQQLLQVVREKYDFVLIDSPPLLPVTDASVVAAAADGVVLLLRVRKNMRSAALLSMEKLRAVGAKVLGVVVRGQFDGQGRNGGYGYGYGRGYGYGYEYGYGAADEAEETPPLVGVAAANGNTAQNGKW
ncbi:MAG: polysaccharide biosynthesis tyrosine autokinase [Planctomycetaceae bacterium]|nr:polysaccharide biosynthesis tyrosine autokinase [Planctomycetaceae bacterium]